MIQAFPDTDWHQETVEISAAIISKRIVDAPKEAAQTGMNNQRFHDHGQITVTERWARIHSEQRFATSIIHQQQ